MLLRKEAAGQVRYVVVEVATGSEVANFAAEAEGGLFWWDVFRPDVLYFARAGSAELVEVAARSGETSVAYEFEGCDQITFGPLVGSVGFASGKIGVICGEGAERLWAVYGMQAGAEVVGRSPALVNGAPIPLGIFPDHYVAIGEDRVLTLQSDLSLNATIFDDPVTSFAVVRDAGGVDQLVASLGPTSPDPGAIVAFNLIAGTRYNLFGADSAQWPALPSAVVQGVASEGSVVAVSSPETIELVALEAGNHTKRSLEVIASTGPTVPRVALNAAPSSAVYSTDAESPGTTDSYLSSTP